MPHVIFFYEKIKLFRFGDFLRMHKNAQLSTSGLKFDISSVFNDPDFL